MRFHPSPYKQKIRNWIMTACAKDPFVTQGKTRQKMTKIAKPILSEIGKSLNDKASFSARIGITTRKTLVV
jgi:hypothetical protein